MQHLLDSFSDLGTSHKVICVVGGIGVVAATTVVVKKLLHKEKKIQHPRDTVIVHQFGRGPYAPSLSPFVIKLETFLRIAKIPYEVEHALTPGSKGKWPWIEYNDESVADSEFCIDFLKKKFKVDINSRLTTFDKGVATAFRVMVDEHFGWCVAMFRYIYDTECTLIKKSLNLNRFMVWFFRRQAKKAVYIQGTGRHSKEEVTVLMERELKAVVDVLGKKKFLLGDEASEADCAVFGQLSQIYWHAGESEPNTIMREKYPTLVTYCERMKTTYWPDWDDCTTRGFTAEATK